MKTDETQKTEKSESLQNFDEVLSPDTQETVEGGANTPTDEDKKLEDDDWCLCNNLVINL